MEACAAFEGDSTTPEARLPLGCAPAPWPSFPPLPLSVAVVGLWRQQDDTHAKTIWVSRVEKVQAWKSTTIQRHRFWIVLDIKVVP